MRPKAIRRFEIMFFIYLAFSILFTAMTWDDRMAVYYMSPGSERLLAYLPLYFTIAGFAVDLILWFCVARLGNGVAKWVYVVLVSARVIMQAFSLTLGDIPGTMLLLTNIVALAIKAVSIAFLFQPSASDWFRIHQR